MSTASTLMAPMSPPMAWGEQLPGDIITEDIEAVAPVATKPRQLIKNNIVPLLALPQEILINIYSFLNPIDAVCLSLANSYLYSLVGPQKHHLTIGSPGSLFPIPRIEGCKFCVPVLYYPHHCELHYHLRSFIPSHLTFCSGPCSKFTACEQKGFSDSAEYCGSCGTSYWRRYERGRRIIDMSRPGEKQERLLKWYNDVCKRVS